MTEITICNSGSSSNGYLLKSADQILVLELGCRFMDYVKQLNMEDFASVRGCIASHW